MRGSFGGLFPGGDPQHRGQASQHFDACALGGVRIIGDHYTLYQRANCRHEARGALALDDRIADERDPPAILLHDLRVQDDGRERLMLGELGFGNREQLATLLDRILDLGHVHAARERCHQSADLCLEVFHACLGRAEALGHRLARGGAGFVIALDHLRDGLRREQLLLQAG
ncbi:hypothetical protein MZO42_06115 [Sphingomonas psychrotolerans]|uniref:Uncharacterized protein n=1 Tax=Sphingomonas psychrotolerans TaxID=1327635 RepID=A0ABU3N430_9SPHN|nr:hypothetical protein [Sphingomonas psychrotolerans]MDT8758266.1 hypothetical protein [Sphingomonas psychrotolerans]